jgi:hypothetical protein
MLVMARKAVQSASLKLFIHCRRARKRVAARRRRAVQSAYLKMFLAARRARKKLGMERIQARVVELLGGRCSLVHTNTTC